MRIRHWQDVASLFGRVAGAVAVRPRLCRGSYLDRPRAWVVRHCVCRRGIRHSVLSRGMGRAAHRSGSAGGTLDDGLRAGLGHGKRYGIGHTGDLVRNLRTNDRSRVHHHDCRRLCARRGGTNWGRANTTGTGHSDSLLVGGYGITWFGRAYLSSVLAITNSWFTSNRSAISSPRTFPGKATARGSKAVIRAGHLES